MALHSLPEVGSSVQLSFSEEISRRPTRDNLKSSNDTANFTAATLNGWAFDAACAYPKWLAQPSFLLQWCPKDTATSIESYTFTTTDACNWQQHFNSCGELRIAGVLPVLEFGLMAVDSPDASGRGGTTIHITGGLLTSATHQPVGESNKTSNGVLSFECRHSANGKVEFRTSLSR